MSSDTFNIHEWEKEKCDELVRAESRRVDYDDGFENGHQDGIKLGKEEMLHQNIIAMLEQNIDLETISKITGKTIEEIRKISENKGE